jgi:hypothetical protein
MKLKEFINIHIDSFAFGQLRKAELERLKSELLKTDEFSSVTKLTLLDDLGDSQYYVFDERAKLTNKVSLYSIMISPDITNNETKENSYTVILRLTADSVIFKKFKFLH